MSASRRGATDLSGVLIVDKPAGVTSHDVVSTIRRITGERRVGHAGTLDPAATGVLVVLVGPATRLTPYLAAAEKSYLARIVFGTRTDTDDAEGEVVEELAVPGSVLDERIAAASLAASLGTSSQTPPAFSAIKQGGRVAHREARAGAPMEMVPRTIHVHAASLEDIDPGPRRAGTSRSRCRRAPTSARSPATSAPPSGRSHTSAR